MMRVQCISLGGRTSTVLIACLYLIFHSAFLVVGALFYHSLFDKMSLNWFLSTVVKVKMAIILPTGQWYAPSAVINDALIMPEYARVC